MRNTNLIKTITKSRIRMTSVASNAIQFQYFCLPEHQNSFTGFLCWKKETKEIQTLQFLVVKQSTAAHLKLCGIKPSDSVGAHLPTYVTVTEVRLTSVSSQTLNFVQVASKPHWYLLCVASCGRVEVIELCLSINCFGLWTWNTSVEVSPPLPPSV